MHASKLVLYSSLYLMMWTVLYQWLIYFCASALEVKEGITHAQGNRFPLLSETTFIDQLFLPILTDYGNLFSLITAFQKLYFEKRNFLIGLWKLQHIESFDMLTLLHCNIQCMLCQVLMLCQVILLYRGQKSFYPKWVVESYCILNHPKLLWLCVKMHVTWLILCP